MADQFDSCEVQLLPLLTQRYPPAPVTVVEVKLPFCTRFTVVARAGCAMAQPARTTTATTRTQQTAASLTLIVVIVTDPVPGALHTTLVSLPRARAATLHRCDSRSLSIHIWTCRDFYKNLPIMSTRTPVGQPDPSGSETLEHLEQVTETLGIRR